MRLFKVIEHDGKIFIFDWDQELPEAVLEGRTPTSKLIHYCASVVVNIEDGKILKNRYGLTS